MRGGGRAWIVAAILGVACAPIGGLDPVPEPMPGCYDVSTTPDWAAFVETTGLKRAPAVVGIDASPDRYLLVPVDWREPERSLTSNTARWNEFTMGYRISGDSLVALYDKRRRLAGDSMVVYWAGFDGGVTALLAPTGAGFEGRMFATGKGGKRGPNGTLTLSRRSCPAVRLVSSRPANEPASETRHWSDYVIPPR